MVNEIAKICEEVSKEICDNYCRYNHEANTKDMDDDEYMKWLDEYCDKCPLNRIN